MIVIVTQAKEKRMGPAEGIVQFHSAGQRIMKDLDKDSL